MKLFFFFYTKLILFSLFVILLQGLLSQSVISSAEKLPSRGSKHLRLTPVPHVDEMTSSALVNINPFTPESYRKQFLQSNGKRKTRGDL